MVYNVLKYLREDTHVQRNNRKGYIGGGASFGALTGIFFELRDNGPVINA